MAELNNPHDRFFKEVFSRREVAQDFLGHYLPEPVAALVDFTSLQLAKDSFVDAALQPHYSDLLYQVRLVDGLPTYVYVLFEHKSYPDPLTPFQRLRYRVRLWEQELRQGAERLTPVIPLVVYHGLRAWPGEAHFGALFAGPEPLRGYWPEFGFQVYDLSAYGDEELRGAAFLQGTLLLLKYILRPEMGERLPGILGVLGELTRRESGVEALYTILRYVSQASEAVSEEGLRQAVTEAFSTTGGEIMTTLAEKWVEEGMEERLREDVLEVLDVRFGRVPAEVEAQVRRLRGQQALEGWLRRAVVVESLPAFAEELSGGQREG